MRKIYVNIVNNKLVLGTQLNEYKDTWITTTNTVSTTKWNYFSLTWNESSYIQLTLNEETHLIHMRNGNSIVTQHNYIKFICYNSLTLLNNYMLILFYCRKK